MDGLERTKESGYEILFPINRHSRWVSTPSLDHELEEAVERSVLINVHRWSGLQLKRPPSTVLPTSPKVLLFIRGEVHVVNSTF